ncbi:MAG: T9SS type A sorting domain-containing protein [Bacteroidia bacterium]|nr:T9SS type A sorting domain-containing protein [Bacteroidia bacterium]
MHVKRFLSFFIGTLIPAYQIYSQPITLNNSHMPGANDTLRYSIAQLSSVGDYTQTGTNFTWNFSSLVPIAQGRRDFKHALQTPYAFFFVGIQEYGEKVADTINLGVIKMTNVYNFYKKQTTPTQAFIVDGLGVTFSNVPVPSYFSDKDELYFFPLSYPKYDSTTFRFSTPNTTLLPFVYTKTGYRVTKCDGWGTITTPYGTAPCLRIITTQYSTDSIKNQFFPLVFPNVQRSYQWLTTTSKIPFLEITGNMIGNQFTPTLARYRDNYLALTSANEYSPLEPHPIVFPIPAFEKIYLKNLPPRTIGIEIINLDGKVIKKWDEMANHVMDISDLEEGIYLLKGVDITNNLTFRLWILKNNR